jgi:SAM-dependent methyltransferase
MPAATESAIRLCPLCGADNRAQPPSRYSEAPWEIKTCAKCGFVYLENPPNYAELEENFAWEKTSAAEETRRNTARPLAKRLSRAFRHFRQRVLKRDKLPQLLTQHLPRGKVLDVGCGGGSVLRSLPERYEPHGIEISKALAAQADALARARGGRVVQASAVAGLAQFPAAAMDGALLSAFLEHEAQPAVLLRELHRVLRPGAPVIVKVPNYASVNRTVRGAKWCGFRHPDHVNYFTPASLASLARACGFGIARCTAGDRWPLSDNLWMVLEKPRPGAAG